MNLLKALSTVSAMTLLSRITGLARESIKAVAFGAGLQMDAFEAAFRLPNILRRLFAEGAFSQAFVPILAEYKRQRGDDATRHLVGTVGALLAVVLLVISALGVLAAPWLVYLLASGFAKTPGKVELTAELIRIMFPYALFISLVSLAGGVLNVYRQFAIPAFTPVILNLSIIGAAILLAPHVDPPIMALAWGVAVGGVAQLALMEFPSALLGVALGTILLPSLAKHHHDENQGQYRALLDWGLRLTFILALPAALALALLATPLIATLYQYGRFTVGDVWQTRAALLGYSVGLLGLIAVKILAPGFYARQDMRTPVRSAFDRRGRDRIFRRAVAARISIRRLQSPRVAVSNGYRRCDSIRTAGDAVRRGRMNPALHHQSCPPGLRYGHFGFTHSA